MKSILQEKNGTCYLCRKLHNSDYQHNYTEEHHVFGGTANRKLSEKYGLKVYLCIYHHREGPEAVHFNAKNSELLKMDAQEIFERTHTREEFMEIFGRNWLEVDPMQQAIEVWEEFHGAAGYSEKEKSENAAGFQILPTEDALDGMGKGYLE